MPLASKSKFDTSGMLAYTKHQIVGSGTFGEVWQAMEPRTGTQVALKLIKMDREADGFPITAIREIKILKSLKHNNIVALRDIMTDLRKDESGVLQRDVYMVFDFVEHDLAGLLETRPTAFTKEHVKSFTQQLLCAIEYMHSMNVLHRDLKGANILISSQNVLKVADWGLARPFEGEPGTLAQYTHRVITLWYRPPELLPEKIRVYMDGKRGTMKYKPAYGTPADMWSVGCIFGELMKQSAILQGRSEMDQLKIIFDLCGAPTEETWPGFSKIDDIQRIQASSPESSVRATFSHLRLATSEAVDLLEALLTIDPRRRLAASTALEHAYFRVPPPAPETLPPLSTDGKSCHEYGAKKLREKVRQEKEREKERERDGRSAAITAGAQGRNLMHAALMDDGVSTADLMKCLGVSIDGKAVRRASSGSSAIATAVVATAGAEAPPQAKHPKTLRVASSS